MKIINLSLILLTCILYSCGLGAGTLGGFEKITFFTSKRILVAAIDSLFAQNPEYKITEKWKKGNNWSERGYDFLDTRIFYFKSTPWFVAHETTKFKPHQIH